MLDIQNLSAAYGKATALENISLNVKPGELVAVLGPNGAGKSTLLKAISRALASQGTLNFEGRSLHAVATENVVGLGICHCPEGRRLFPELTVAKNLQLGAYRDIARSELANSLAQVYEVFPRLKERQEQLAGSMSGGEQQMVALARSLMSRPRILLIDEPSVGLAPILVQHVIDQIRELKRMAGLTVLMAEQNFTQAMRVADRGYLIVHGEIAVEGSAEELYGSDLVKKYYMGL